MRLATALKRGYSAEVVIAEFERVSLKAARLYGSAGSAYHFTCKANLENLTAWVYYSLWMPTVLRQDGFDFVIYPNDHTPMHVHVFKGEGEARIDLSPVRLIEVWGMKKSDARKAKGIAVGRQDYLIKKWREIHG